MFRKYLVLTLTMLVVNLSAGTAAFAAAKTGGKESKYAEKIKANISKLGTGRDARVKVKLTNGTKVKGYISRAGEISFDVTDPNNGATTEVPYPNAKKVTGNNLSTGAKIAIGAGIAVGIVLIIVLLKASSD